MRIIDGRTCVDYFPEDEDTFGSISVSCEDLDDYTIQFSPEEDTGSLYNPYAFHVLRDMIEVEREVGDCMVMRY